MRHAKLAEPERAQLLACLRQRRELTTKKLMARFRVGRTTIWKFDQELRDVPHETKQIVHKPMTELELDALAAELKRA